jgi:glycosyltransferase involved in cell wall biosynthesis
MIHVFVNALAASSGGGLTYVRNIVPHLAVRDDVYASILLSPKFRQEFCDYPNVGFFAYDVCANGARRFWQEQSLVPKLIARSGADVLLSTGNFALRKSPVPQILLSRNSLYTSQDFYRDLTRRGEYRLWLDTKIKGVLAKKSIHWADRRVAPSRAFARELENWTGVPVDTVHHGFDRDLFFSNYPPLPAMIQQKLDAADDAVRLLLVSQYNYYRNFETLLRALPVAREKLAPRKVKLLLTCRLRSEDNPGPFGAESAATLVTELGIGDEVVELGAIAYGSLHRVYKACHVYVTPAYAETFAHPLVEAMACGLPVVASDLAVHREICGDSALYFERFSEGELVERLMEIVQSPACGKRLSNSGLHRARNFSWETHVDEILAIAESLMSG